MFDPRELGAKCDECPLYARNMKPIRPPYRHKKNVLAVIGDKPSYSDIRPQRFYSGKTGDFLNVCLQRLNIKENEVHKTKALLCPTPKPDEDNPFTESDYKNALNCCRPRLSKELDGINGALSCGNRALFSTLGKDKISNWHGAPDSPPDFLGFNPGLRTVPTFQPAFILRGKPQYTPVFLTHLYRAYEIATNRHVEWKWADVIELDCDGDDQATLKALGAVARHADQGHPVTCDIEASGLNYHNIENFKITCIGFATGTPHFTAEGEFSHLTDTVMVSIQLPITNPLIDSLLRYILRRAFIANHNWIMYDKPALEGQGFKTTRNFFDTLIAQTLIAPDLPNGLAFTCGVETAAPRWKDEFRKGGKDDPLTKRLLSPEKKRERALYNARDCFSNLILFYIQYYYRLRELNKGFEQYKQKAELALIAVEMRLTGVHFDKKAALNHRTKLLAEVEKCDEQLQRLATKLNIEDFKVTKKVSIAELFTKLGAPVLKKSEKTGQPSYDASVLLSYAGSPDKLLASTAYVIARRRKHAKLASTYINGYLNRAYKGKIHATWNPIGARSGRWACKQPNLMNVPKGGLLDLGKGHQRVKLPGMRDMIVPKDGWVIIKCDYSQLELRILALLAGAKRLIDGFAAGYDIHSYNCALLLGINLEDVTKPLRDMTKRAIYGTNYRSKPRELWAKLVVDYPNLRPRQIEKFQQKWFDLNPEILEYFDKIMRIALTEDRCVAPLSGRVKCFHGNIEITKLANYPIQMTAIDIIDLAMLRIYELIKHDSQNIQIIMQIHDDLTFHIKLTDEKGESNLAKYLPIIRAEMSRAVSLNGYSVEFPVDLELGYDWGNTIELEKALKFLKILEAFLFGANQLY